jgi:hypothetical protein
MFYFYNKEQAKFQLLNWKFYTTLLSIFILTLTFIYKIGRKDQINHYTPSEIEIILSKINDSISFTPERFQKELERLNVKFPHIVYAQSLLETGYFTSNIFLENHNLFGMKQARIRVNTAKGTHNGHAYYDSWQESVFDYAFYQCRYLPQINNDEEYFQYLSQKYAEDTNYISKLKQLIESEKLKEIFK